MIYYVLEFAVMNCETGYFPPYEKASVWRSYEALAQYMAESGAVKVGDGAMAWTRPGPLNHEKMFYRAHACGGAERPIPDQYKGAAELYLGLTEISRAARTTHEMLEAGESHAVISYHLGFIEGTVMKLLDVLKVEDSKHGQPNRPPVGD